MSFIKTIAVEIAEEKIPIEKLEDYGKLDERDKQTYLQLGIETVSVETRRSSYDLALAASIKAIEQSGVDRSQIDQVIYISPRAPDEFIASYSTRLLKDLALESKPVIEVGGLGCVTISSAIALANTMLQGDGNIRQILIAYGSKSITRNRYRKEVTINGDGGCAFIVSRESGEYQVIDHHIECNGDFWDLYQVDYKNKKENEWDEVCLNLGHYSFILAVETRNRYIRIIENILIKNNIKKDNNIITILQNLSQSSMSFFETYLDLAIAQSCRENLSEFGHLGGMDIAVNLKKLPLLNENETIAVLNNSPSAAWSVLLLGGTNG